MGRACSVHVRGVRNGRDHLVDQIIHGRYLNGP
jgi:hypothetical protein